MNWVFKIILGFCVVLSFSGGADAANVLFLGDSHSVKTGFESVIYEDIQRSGGSFTSIAVCSSRPSHWVDNPRVEFPCWLLRENDKQPELGEKRRGIPQISEIFEKYGPEGFDLVIIEQGDNLLGDSKSNVTDDSLKLLSALENRMKDKKFRCYWLGPTWPSNGKMYKKTIADTQKVRDGIIDALEKYNASSGGDCKYIDGMELLPEDWTRRQEGDGIHFSIRGEVYKKWAQEAALRVEIDRK